MPLVPGDSQGSSGAWGADFAAEIDNITSTSDLSIARGGEEERWCLGSSGLRGASPPYSQSVMVANPSSPTCSGEGMRGSCDRRERSAGAGAVRPAGEFPCRLPGIVKFGSVRSDRCLELAQSALLERMHGVVSGAKFACNR